MDVLDMAAMSKTWEQFAFSCEIANISNYFAANLLVPDEICFSDGSYILLALSKLRSQPQGTITASTETPSPWDILCMSIALVKKMDSQRRRKTSNDLGKKVILNPQYGFAEFMLGRCG